MKTKAAESEPLLGEARIFPKITVLTALLSLPPLPPIFLCLAKKSINKLRGITRKNI